MFKINRKIKNLRLGTIRTKNGEIKTPFFMPDATRGFIKMTANSEINKAGIGPMVVNTFHLMLSPGIKKIKKFGGINKFMNYHEPLLSDSGGFQVFSLIHKNKGMGKISDKEVLFKSPVDGSPHKLSPEEAIKIQFDLGVDMMVCLDDCPPNDASKDDLNRAVVRTIFWAKRCRNEYDKQVKKRKITKNNRPLLFSVIQGGNDMLLRKFCAESLIKIGFDGYGFGAMPIGEDGKFADEILEKTANLIPENALRFALGIGKPEDIVKCAHYGWDMFDCVIPTRDGRHGKMFAWEKKNKKDFYKSVNINNSKFGLELKSINSESGIKELRDYSFAYLHHLFKAKDALGQRLASLNNLEFYASLMKKIRKGDFINNL